MPSAASLLSFGYDLLLMQIRGSVLARQGFDVIQVCTLVDCESALGSQPFDLLLLCHTLFKTDRRHAVSLASACIPAPAILALTRGFADYDAPHQPVTEVNVSLGPANLLTTVRKLVIQQATPLTHIKDLAMPQFQGQVKWFNNAKAYGFVGRNDGGNDVFTHFSSIQGEGYKTPKEGDIVTFDIVEGEKGPQADQLRKESLSPNLPVALAPKP